MPRFYLNRFARGNPHSNIFVQCAIIDLLASLQRLTAGGRYVSVGGGRPVGPFARHGQDHRAGPGQSQRPQQGLTLRSPRRCRSQTAGRTLRMALQAQARQLA